MPTNINEFTDKAQQAVMAAQELAEQHTNPNIESAHLLLALVEQQDGVVPEVLKELAVSRQSFTQELQGIIADLPRVSGSVRRYISQELSAALQEGQEEAHRMHDEYVSTEHLLLGIIATATGRVATLLKKNEIDHDHVYEALSKIRGSQRVTDQNPEGGYQALAKYSQDLTEAARKGKLDPVIGRDQEIRRIIQILSRRTKNNPVLVGEAGVGKTAIVEGLAMRIVNGDVPQGLRDRRLLSLDMGSLVAGANTAASSKSVSRPSSKKCKHLKGKSSSLLMSCIR